MKNGSRRLAHERKMIADFGVSVCRGCGEAKSLTEFYKAHAVCIACCRSKNLQYKHKMRIVHMRERRITALQKYLRSCCLDGECPICGNEQHEPGCSIGRLLIDLEVHGWLKEETA